MDTKRCPRCGHTKPVAEFYANTVRSDGLSAYCVPCHRSAGQASAQRQKAAAIAHLGGVCQRCGFADARALQIDHVQGGGNRRRREGEHGPGVYRRVLRADTGEYQLLCANCNWIKRYEEGEIVGARVYERQAAARRVRTPEEIAAAKVEANRKRSASLQARTHERDERIAAAFTKGTTKAQIAAAEDMTYGAVHAVLKRRGLVGVGVTS